MCSIYLNVHGSKKIFLKLLSFTCHPAKVESIYTKQEERVSGMFKISGNISGDILNWFDEKENEFKKDMSASKIFDFHKDQKLKNALSKREKQL